MRRIFIAALFVAAACGGKHSAPATPGGGSAGSGELSAPHHEGEPDQMSPELKKFHDVLAPKWHAAPGAQRTSDTCAAVPEFQADANAIATATPPTTANADTWTAGTRALVDAVGSLASACKANDAAKFDTAFGKVHESFHALMEMAGMHHDMKGMEGMHHEGMEGMHHEGMEGMHGGSGDMHHEGMGSGGMHHPM